ncbi:MAG: hypothetical protein AMXMBFR64_21250 [Myxococcales bacterium]
MRHAHFKTAGWLVCVVLAVSACDSGAGGQADGGTQGAGDVAGGGSSDGGGGLVLDIGGMDDAGTPADVATDAAALDTSDGGAPDGLADGGADGGGPDAGAPDGAGGPDAADGGPGTDTGAGDAGTDTSLPDVTQDTGGPETGEGDAGSDAGGAVDAGEDTGAQDTGAPDTGAPDTGAPDTQGADVTPSPEVCTNGVDDDLDGLTDCYDPDCVKQQGCFEICGNGKDDDVDGLTDCADSDCAGKPGCIENCINGVDDDLDGKTDCADPDCVGTVACVEDCDDGKDNDLDGKTDCADHDCQLEPVCSPVVSCDDVYTCLGEKGCGCKVGQSCPADLGPCIQSCFNNSLCYAGCLNALPPDTKAHWNAWQSCLVQHCASVPDAQFTDCYLTWCLQEYADCFYVGTKSCGDIYNGGCLSACGGNQACIDACFDQLSPSGGMDAILWNDCRFGLCDLDENNAADSQECLAVASWFACADVAGTCNGPVGSLYDCAATTSCITACGGFGLAKQQCMFGCLGGMSGGAVPGVSSLWSCAIEACGSTATAFTPACASSSFSGVCAPEAAGCGL